MMLLNGLVAGDGTLDTFKICKFYADWYNSDPFDIGNTCAAGLKLCNSEKPNPSLVFQHT